MFKKYVWMLRAKEFVATVIGLLIVPVALGAFFAMTAIVFKLVYGLFY